MVVRQPRGLHVALVLALVGGLLIPLQPQLAHADPIVLYRVNAGGGELAAADAGPVWEADTEQYVTAGTTGTASADDDMTFDATVPAGTPDEIFHTERYLEEESDSMTWEFPVDTGTATTVRLHFASRYDGADQVGERVFDVAIDGETVLSDYDIVDTYGHDVGAMEEFVTTSDGTVQIDFVRGPAQNPTILGVEILGEDDGSTGPAPVSFGASGLPSTSLSNPTSLDFGPDDRLYVSQQNGLIKAFDIERLGANDYTVTGSETIDAVASIPNHDDDGSSSGTSGRQVTGLMTAGTAESPELYVTSSDPRIGGGSSGNDTNLDTNSGVLSRLTWNGAAWDHVQLVRGLPRSEENHSTNGLDLDPTTNTLYVMSGGHTNQGAPSNNFSGTPEYALSAAMLSIDLDALDAMDVQSDGSIDHVYDLPTLEDPTGGSAPFGGENGANMAILVEDSPVQIHSPGYRNAYDVVRTESGRIYTFDNGPNGGWGGTPVPSGGSCTNEFNDGGGSFPDNLHHVTGQGYYAGHPNPVRATPDSGLYIYEESDEGWTTIEEFAWDEFDAPPVPASYQSGGAAEIECDYLEPGSGDGALATINSSTNGIAEYTASNFGGAMTGDLLAAAFNGNIYRFQLNASGTEVTQQSAQFSGFGSTPLDVTALGDDAPFPGTVWAATYGSDDITVFEPGDYEGAGEVCDPSAPDGDADGDGFTNADEEQNGTDPCSAGSQPPDVDGDGISDVLDEDDDNDGTLDVDDIFPLDESDGLGTTSAIPASCPANEGTSEPTCLRFQAGSFPNTLLDLGFTGLMRNLGDDYLDYIDDEPVGGGGTNIKRGGASEQLVITEVNVGDAHANTNTQDNAFMFGVDPSTAPDGFVVRSRIQNFPETPDDWQSAGLFIGTGSQDDYVKLVVNANGGDGGIEFAEEYGGSFTTLQQVNDAAVKQTSVDLLLEADPSTGEVSASYVVGDADPVQVGTANAPTSWFSGTDALAVGIIATANGADPFTADWDLLDVSAGEEPVVAPPTAADDEATTLVDEPVTISVLGNDTGELDLDPTSVTVVDDASDGSTSVETDGSITYTPDAGFTGTDTFTYTVADSDGGVSDPGTVTITVTDEPAPLTTVYRLNAAGTDQPVTSGGLTWDADDPYLVAGEQGSGYVVEGTPEIEGTDADEVYRTERYGDPFSYELPLDDGDYTLRLHLAEIYHGVAGTTAAAGFDPGDRVFDVQVEGATLLDAFDLTDVVSDPLTAHVEELPVTVDDGALSVSLLLGSDGVDNAKLSALEVLTSDEGPEDPPGDGDPGATFTMTPGAGDVDASTWSDGTFILTNTSGGGEQITDFRLELTSAIFPDIVFDPDGTAGDLTAKQFTVESEGGTGFVGAETVEPHNGTDNAEGYDALEVTFDDFDPGETITFSIDVDPTSNKGNVAPGPNESGAVSGLEMAGSVVTVAFDDDSALVGDVFSDGSNGGGIAELVPDPREAPVLEAVGLSPPATVSDPSVTVRVSGEPGAPVELLRVLGGMFVGDDGGYDVDPFEANSATEVELLTGETIGPDGTVDIDVNLSRDADPLAELNHLVAIVRGDDGAPSRTSDVAVLELVPMAPVDGVIEARVNAGGPEVAATDDGPAWSADTEADPSHYLTDAYLEGIQNIDGTNQTFSSGVDSLVFDPSTPVGTPIELYDLERYDLPADPVLGYEFDVVSGVTYQLNLYAAELYGPTSSVGARVFDVVIEGETVDTVDLYDRFGDTGGMLSYEVELASEPLTVELVHVGDEGNEQENPKVNALELIRLDDLPAAGELSADVSALDVGEVEVGSSGTGSVTVTNVGGQSVEISSVDLGGVDADVFSVTGTYSATLAAGESTAIEFAFAPDGAGAAVASASVVHDGVNAPVVIDLAGTGTEPEEDDDPPSSSPPSSDPDPEVEPDQEEETYPFSDIEGSAHVDTIILITQHEIAFGFEDGTYRPSNPMTRAQMASLLTRALELPDGDASMFTDVEGTTHEQAIGAVATAGIALGFEDGTFRPEAFLTRAQMASFLQRAFDLSPGDASVFSDVEGNVHEGAIGAVASAGIALGRDDGTFAPDEDVTRGQMASFLVRALGL